MATQVYDKSMNRTRTMTLADMNPSLRRLMQMLVLLDCDDIPIDLLEAHAYDDKYVTCSSRR